MGCTQHAGAGSGVSAARSEKGSRRTATAAARGPLKSAAARPRLKSLSSLLSLSTLAALTVLAAGPSGSAQARAAQAPAPRQAAAPGRELRSLPPAVQAALRQARIPPQAVSVVIHELLPAGAEQPRYTQRQPTSLHWQPDVARNPASLAKLLTTAAALDQLGPAWRWRTPVWLDGPVVDGVLQGHLHLQGQGDPQLVLEQLWLLLRQVQARGVRRIQGDIVLDNRRFSLPPGHAGDFDNEPLRPYNVRADALLLNQHAKVYSFRPDLAAGVARVSVEPPLAGALVDSSVPLVATGPCGRWRDKLQAQFSAPQTLPAAAASAAEPPRPDTVVPVRFLGAYPLACGELNWSVADPHPESYNARLLAGLWRDMGGAFDGQVRSGPPPSTPPSFEHRSPALAEVVRDINKFSNNVMAQQLFLTLAAEARAAAAAAPAGVAPGTDTAAGDDPPAAEAEPAAATNSAAPGADPALPSPLPAVTPEDARAHLQAWLEARLGAEALQTEALVLDNGSGLSRSGRITARLLARLLGQMYDSPQMPEFMASLPIGGVDGTLRRSRATPGRAHLKTGSLRDVNGLAGYTLSHSGRRYVLVAMVNHPNAGASRAALDALVQWTLHDLPPR